MKLILVIGAMIIFIGFTLLYYIIEYHTILYYAMAFSDEIGSIQTGSYQVCTCAITA